MNLSEILLSENPHYLFLRMKKYRMSSYQRWWRHYSMYRYRQVESVYQAFPFIHLTTELSSNLRSFPSFLISANSFNCDNAISSTVFPNFCRLAKASTNCNLTLNSWPLNRVTDFHGHWKMIRSNWNIQIETQIYRGANISNIMKAKNSMSDYNWCSLWQVVRNLGKLWKR